jgi:hypothetical protein
VPVVGDHVAGRAQAVAVQGAGGVAAVGEHDARRAVPGLHVHGVVFVEGPQVRVHVVTFCQAGGISRRMARNRSTPPASSTSSMLSRLSESEPSMFTRGWSSDSLGRSGEENLWARAIAQLRLPRTVLISPLWARKAKRLGQAPLGPGIGGEALVEHADGGLQARIVQVLVEHRQVLRHHQALVGDHVGGQARHVEHRVLGERHLGAAAGDEQARSKAASSWPSGGVDEHLLDDGQGLERLGAAGPLIGGHARQPATARPSAFQVAVEGVPCRVGQGSVGVEEHDAGGIESSPSAMPASPAMRRRKASGFFMSRPQPSPVLPSAAMAPRWVSRARALMAVLHHPVAGLAVHVGDQAEAAVVALELGAVQAALGCALVCH